MQNLRLRKSYLCMNDTGPAIHSSYPKNFRQGYLVRTFNCSHVLDFTGLQIFSRLSELQIDQLVCKIIQQKTFILSNNLTYCLLETSYNLCTGEIGPPVQPSALISPLISTTVLSYRKKKIKNFNHCFRLLFRKGKQNQICLVLSRLHIRDIVMGLLAIKNLLILN